MIRTVSIILLTCVLCSCQISVHSSGVEDLKFPTGKGVKVALLDLGIDENHPMAGEVLKAYDMVPEDIDGNSPYELKEIGGDWHGTEVAGVIWQIAPESLILSYKVFHAFYDGNGNGFCDYGEHLGISDDRLLRHINPIGEFSEYQAINLDILEGLRKAVEDGADVINVSIGEPSSPEVYYSFTKEFDEIATEIPIVVSSGNYGTVAAPGDGYNVITVGAIDPSGNIWRNGKMESARGIWWEKRRKPELLAYGQVLTLNSDWESGAELISLEGTSFAAPQVTGAIALLKELNPDLTPVEIKAILINSSDPPEDKSWGIGVLNIERAINERDEVISGRLNKSPRYYTFYSPGGELRVTLVWEIEEEFSKIEFYLESPRGERYYDLEALEKDNVRRITIENSEPGIWRAFLLGNREKFAIAYGGDGLKVRPGENALLSIPLDGECLLRSEVQITQLDYRCDHLEFTVPEDTSPGRYELFISKNNEEILVIGGLEVQAEKDFQIERNATEVIIKNQGNSDIEIRVYDANGNEIESFVLKALDLDANGIVDLREEKRLVLNPGEYLIKGAGKAKHLRIESDGGTPMAIARVPSNEYGEMSVYPKEIEVEGEVGQRSISSITLENIGEVGLRVSISPSESISDYVNIAREIYIGPGEKREIPLEIRIEREGEIRGYINLDADKISELVSIRVIGMMKKPVVEEGKVTNTPNATSQVTPIGDENTNGLSVKTELKNKRLRISLFSNDQFLGYMRIGEKYFPLDLTPGEIIQREVELEGGETYLKVFDHKGNLVYSQEILVEEKERKGIFFIFLLTILGAITLRLRGVTCSSLETRRVWKEQF